MCPGFSSRRRRECPLHRPHIGVSNRQTRSGGEIFGTRRGRVTVHALDSIWIPGAPGKSSCVGVGGLTHESKTSQSGNTQVEFACKRRWRELPGYVLPDASPLLRGQVRRPVNCYSGLTERDLAVARGAWTRLKFGSCPSTCTATPYPPRARRSSAFAPEPLRLKPSPMQGWMPTRLLPLRRV